MSDNVAYLVQMERHVVFAPGFAGKALNLPHVEHYKSDADPFVSGYVKVDGSGRAAVSAVQLEGLLEQYPNQVFDAGETKIVEVPFEAPADFDMGENLPEAAVGFLLASESVDDSVDESDDEADDGEEE